MGWPERSDPAKDIFSLFFSVLLFACKESKALGVAPESVVGLWLGDCDLYLSCKACREVGSV